MENHQDELLQFLLTADQNGAKNLLAGLARIHGYKKTMVSLLEPVLIMFGDRWVHDTDISIAHGYVAARIAEDIMIKVTAETPQNARQAVAKTPLVLGNIEDDYHALGRKLVGTFLRMAGWDVHDLGNDVVAGEFVDKALAVGAPIIGVSAMMHNTAVNIKKLRSEIDGRGLTDSIKLAVGGAIFKIRPELVEEVGGDATATNAIEAPEIMKSLLNDHPLRGAQ